MVVRSGLAGLEISAGIEVGAVDAEREAIFAHGVLGVEKKSAPGVVARPEESASLKMLFGSEVQLRSILNEGNAAVGTNPLHGGVSMGSKHALEGHRFAVE